MSTFKTPNGIELPILNLRGKDYLEVKYRIVWFREAHPLWAIETELVQLTDKAALARAVIRDEKGRAVSTSHKFENVQGFPDFIEKAETGAIGRALALIGFGTQFCADELDEGERIVDSPVERKGGLTHTGPLEEVGNPNPLMYRIPFGKYRDKTLEEVYQKDGEQSISGYIAFLEGEASKKNKPISGVAAEFIKRAEMFLSVVENRQARAMREPGDDS